MPQAVKKASSLGDRIAFGPIAWWNLPPARAARCGVSAMSDRGSGPTEAAIPLAPKLNARSDPSDPLDKAGHLILDMVRQAAVNAQASYQQAAEMSRKLSAQLRGAEDRIREPLKHICGVIRT